MEITKNEVLAIQEVLNDKLGSQVLELSDLQLALAGGGHGDILLG